MFSSFQLVQKKKSKNLRSNICTVYEQYTSALPVKGQGGSCNICLIIFGKGKTNSLLYNIDFFFSPVFFSYNDVFVELRKGNVTELILLSIQNAVETTCELVFGHLVLKSCLVRLIMRYLYCISWLFSEL